jgi:hypothetical protein
MTQCVGTWRWTAPEVFSSCDYDEKIDIYSFAMLVYEVVTSKLPYSDKWPDSTTGMSARAVLHISQGHRPAVKKSQFKGCPIFLRDLMLKCWEGDPSARPSFAEVASKLREKLAALRSRKAKGLAEKDGAASDTSSKTLDGPDLDREESGLSIPGFGAAHEDAVPAAPKTWCAGALRPPAPPVTMPDPPKMPITAPAGLQRFIPGNAPPTPPQSKHFRFEGTTVFVETDQPHEIGNKLLDYISSQFDACVTKVTPTKCSFKTEVRVDGVTACTVKVRIHSKTAEFEDTEGAQLRHYAVRFQRRSGCAFVFQNMFDSIQNFLAAEFKIVQGSSLSDDQGWGSPDGTPKSPTGIMRINEMDPNVPCLLISPEFQLSGLPDLPEDLEHGDPEMDPDDLDLPPMMSLSRF